MNVNDHEHHNHEQSCQCGHDHDHCHSHETEGLKQEEITVTHHEGATIYSAECTIEREYIQVRNMLSLELEGLGDWVESKGGIVGHIKAFLTESQYSAMLSTTGGEVQIKEKRTPKTDLKLAIIVFYEDEKELHLVIEELLEKLKIER